MKEGKRGVITITDGGIVSVPVETKMTIGEIADLFGIYCRTAKRYIRAIEKSGIVRGDDSMGSTVEGRNIYPDYYGLDIVIALAFRIQSKNAQMFREWLCGKVVRKEIPEMPIISIQNYMLNGISLINWKMTGFF
jgi:predicted transcriptional regulator